MFRPQAGVDIVFEIRKRIVPKRCIQEGPQLYRMLADHISHPVQDHPAYQGGIHLHPYLLHVYGVD